MGMIDQRDQRRPVVSDGPRQAQAKAEDGRGLAGEQRAIRLLCDGGAGRAPGRIAPVCGPPAASAEADNHGPGPEPAAPPGGEEGTAERPRRVRYDETHATASRPVGAHPQGAEGRAPGPLRARVALRHRRDAS